MDENLDISPDGYVGIGILRLCQLNSFVFEQKHNLGRIFGTSKMNFSPPVAKTAVRSKAVVLLLLSHFLSLLPL